MHNNDPMLPYNTTIQMLVLVDLETWLEEMFPNNITVLRLVLVDHETRLEEKDSYSVET